MPRVYANLWIEGAGFQLQDQRVAVFPKTSMGSFGKSLPGCFAEYMVIPSYVALKNP